MEKENNKNTYNEIKKNLMENDRFKGIWIPKYIWLREDLSWLQKNLIMEIDMFCCYGDIEKIANDTWENKNAFCGTNKYLGKIFNISASRISELLSDFRNKGLINIRYIKYKDEYENIKQERYIMVSEKFCNLKAGFIPLETPLNITDTPSENTKGGIVKTEDPPTKNTEYSNNSISNNISKDIYNISSKKEEEINKNNFTNKEIKNKKNIFTNKKKNINKKNIKFSNGFTKALLVWNTAKKPASTHKLDKDNPTSTTIKANMYYNALKAGKFKKICTNVTKEWINKEKINSDLILKKWTDKEIREVIRKCILQFEDGYWPYTFEEKKNILPKSLETTLYNPMCSCPSVFLKIASHEPKKDVDRIKEVKLKHEDLAQDYIDEFFDIDNMDIKEKNKVIRLINKITQKYHDIYEQSIIVNKKERKRRIFQMKFQHCTVNLLNEHIKFLNKKLDCKDPLPITTLMSTENTFWDEFIEKFENDNDIDIYLNDSELKELFDIDEETKKELREKHKKEKNL